MGQNRILCVDFGSKNVNGLELIKKASVPMEGVRLGAVTDIEKCKYGLQEAFSAVQANPNDTVVVGIGSYYVENTESSQADYIPDGESVIDDDVERESVTDDDVEKLFDRAENAYLSPELELLDVVTKYYNIDEMKKNHNPEGLSGVRLRGLVE